MRFVTRMADRLVDAVAPRATAAACIAGTPFNYTQECGCKNHILRVQTCTVGCFGATTCQSCHNSSIEC